MPAKAEVKALASQTAKANGEIASQVSEIQDATLEGTSQELLSSPEVKKAYLGG